MPIISRDQLQNCINSLVETAEKLLKQNSGIPYVTFKDEVEHNATFYLQQKTKNHERIVQENKKL